MVRGVELEVKETYHNSLTLIQLISKVDNKVVHTDRRIESVISDDQWYEKGEEYNDNSHHCKDWQKEE